MLKLEKEISSNTRKIKKLLSLLRNNSVKIGVVACVFSVSCVNASIIQGKKESSVLFGQFFGLNDNSTEIVEKGTTFPNINYSYSASLVGINMPKARVSVVDAEEESYSANSSAIFDSTSIFASNSPLTTNTASDSQNKRNSVETYEVQKGDTISAIAAKYGISINTLLWANNLTERSFIRPGDKLEILPVTGILHIVKQGETISGLASKYNAASNKIMAFNDLPADAGVKVGQKLVIPDGSMPVVRATITKSAQSIVSNYMGSSLKGPNGEKPHLFPWGQCTWYVSTRRFVPWGGNAKSWLTNAQAYGYKTGSVPSVGSIMVMGGSSWLSRLFGHVVYVEAVSDSTVTISEMNHIGLGKKSVRVLSVNDASIRGYIY